MLTLTPTLHQNDFIDYCLGEGRMLSSRKIAIKYGKSKKWVLVTMGARQKEQGLKPLVVSKGIKVTYEANFPRQLDMLLGFMEGFAGIPAKVFCFMDETKVKYGAGQHVETVRHRSGARI